MTLTDVATKMFKTVKLLAHPVGSIYMSTESTSPTDLFGGTLEQITDTFLWCAGTSHAAGTTGGEETHKLTVAEMPVHGHNIFLYNNAGTKGNVQGWSNNGATRTTYTGGALNPNVTPWVNSNITCAGSGAGDRFGLTDSAGSSNSHNNMPPYLSVYAWKRTA